MDENVKDRPHLQFKDVLDVVLRLHERAHHYWTFYIASVFIFVGWILSIDRSTLADIRWILSFAALVVGVSSLTTTTSVYWYLRACIAEAQVLSTEVTIITPDMRDAIARMQVMPKYLIIVANVCIVLFAILLVWLL